MLRPPKIHGWIQLNLWSKRVIVKLEVKCPWDGYENLPLNLKSGKLMTSSILVFSIPLYYFLNVNQKPQTESSLGSMSVCKFSQFPAVFSVPSHPFFLFFFHICNEPGGIRSFRLRVVSPTVCSPTVRVDSPTSYMSVRLRVRCWSFNSELIKVFVPCIIPSILSSMARHSLM